MIWLGIIFFGLGTIWDLITSTLGIGYSFGSIKEIGSNPVAIVGNLITSMGLGTLMALLLACFIIFLDALMFKFLGDWHSHKKKPVTWILLFIWLPFKYVDLATTIIGTGKCFHLNTGAITYPDWTDILILAAGQSSSQLMIIIAVSLVISFSSVCLKFCIDLLPDQ